MPVRTPRFREHPERRRARGLRAAFAAEFGARRVKWSAHNLSRWLNATGERPERIEAMRDILERLGLKRRPTLCAPFFGALDHAELWGRDGLPWAVVGHPYQVNDAERARLNDLARFGTLGVSVDDRPSHYGFGSHHVRIELLEPLRPFHAPTHSSGRTRRARRAAREAFVEAGLPVID